MQITPVQKSSLWDRHRMDCGAWILTMSLLGLASSVQASSPFPCTGSAPGQRMIGLSPASQGQASFPLCVTEAIPEAAQQQRAAPPPPEYGSVALHDDFDRPWGVRGVLGGMDKAAALALESCKEHTGDRRGDGLRGPGCWTDLNWRSAYATVVRASDGTLFTGVGPFHTIALQNAREKCAKFRPQLLPCEEVQLPFVSKGSLAPAPKSYLGVAWAQGQECSRGLWVASGRPSAQLANDDAIAACQRDLPNADCSLAILGGNVTMVPVLHGGPEAIQGCRVILETTPERAMEAARVHCTKQGGKCTAQARYSAKDRWVYMHDFQTNTTHQKE